MNQIYQTADVQKTSDHSVQIKRSFKASKALVFKAFTTPSIIKRWMLGPPGWDMPICEMDVNEGGKYRWRWKNKSDGMEFGFFGVYRSVKPLQELVHTQTFDPGTVGGDMGRECVATVTFSDRNDVTTVTTHIKYQSAGDLEKALSTGMTDGMELSYELLDGLIQKNEGLQA